MARRRRWALWLLHAPGGFGATPLHHGLGRLQFRRGINAPIAEHRASGREAGVRHQFTNRLGLRDLVGHRVDARGEAGRILRQFEAEALQCTNDALHVSATGTQPYERVTLITPRLTLVETKTPSVT